MNESWNDIQDTAHQWWDTFSEMTQEFWGQVRNAWDSALSFLYRHDLILDLTTIWCLAVGFAFLCIVKVISWLTLHHQHDQTDVGRELKRQKASEAVICGVMASLYSLTLYAYYREYEFGFWPRFLLRIGLIAGIAAAVWLGVRFITALHHEDWGRPAKRRREA